VSTDEAIRLRTARRGERKRGLPADWCASLTPADKSSCCWSAAGLPNKDICHAAIRLTRGPCKPPHAHLHQARLTSRSSLAQESSPPRLTMQATIVVDLLVL